MVLKRMYLNFLVILAFYFCGFGASVGFPGPAPTPGPVLPAARDPQFGPFNYASYFPEIESYISKYASDIPANIRSEYDAIPSDIDALISDFATALPSDVLSYISE
ncbi:uncharacterized protein BDZ99DRAFT_577061 [Mytilinidion resinicola]|uniref:Uncharacterized protein n=1 Tax=Mytilinidion resinicola TaxID=574789 RepID=A0A6A6XZT0_9PEZI|nr:uncharacterized protein BDZ99DRAFT_577061 [Mytilinidion resinicola]KAF2802076.1 hypothetical protein BDZ99DRAFT_577061 [Mytilinidion resinicola]